LKVAQAEAAAAAEAMARSALEEKQKAKVSEAERTNGTAAKEGSGSPVKVVKRTKIGGRPKRRKSTLTPDELMGLLGD
jgi:hypothetical protein